MINYRSSKSLLTPSRLPASDYVINPYVGCTHGCAYCYARFMGRFTGHSEPWGTYIEAKKYESVRIPSGIAGKTVLIGSVTDAYNPCEMECHLMPTILELLRNCEAHIEILTKSSLVVRDIELIKQLPDSAVGISLSNLNDTDNKRLEPGASSAAERLRALEMLHAGGISTYLFIAPYLPYVTDMDGIIERARPYVDYFCVENLNLRGEAKKRVLTVIGELHPGLEERYREIFVNGGNSYWAELEDSLPETEKRMGVQIVNYMYHEKIRRP